MPRGHAQRPAGLFWPDGEYRLAGTGPWGMALDRGDGIGGGERAHKGAARDQRDDVDAPKRGVERRRRQGVGGRDFLSVTPLTTSPWASVSFARTLSCTDTATSTASRTQRP